MLYWEVTKAERMAVAKEHWRAFELKQKSDREREKNAERDA